jgi:hypothetical protein
MLIYQGINMGLSENIILQDPMVYHQPIKVVIFGDTPFSSIFRQIKQDFPLCPHYLSIVTN